LSDGQVRLLEQELRDDLQTSTRWTRLPASAPPAL